MKFLAIALMGACLVEIAPAGNRSGFFARSWRAGGFCARHLSFPDKKP